MCQFSLIKFRFWTVISAHKLNIYSLSYPLSMHISATYVGSLLPIFILSLFLTRKEWFSYMQTEWYKQQKREKSKPIKVKFIHIFCLAFRLKNFFIKMECLSMKKYHCALWVMGRQWFSSEERKKRKICVRKGSHIIISLFDIIKIEPFFSVLLLDKEEKFEFLWWKNEELSKNRLLNLNWIYAGGKVRSRFKHYFKILKN